MKTTIILFIFLLPFTLCAQQIADTNYKPIIHNPEYKVGEGQVLLIDEGHHNFHTRKGRFKAFSNLLERDGYNVKSYNGAFKEKKLSKGKILIISNALNKVNIKGNWSLPTPSAFTKTEIEILKKWVHEGGSLFLIADHMPFGGAAIDLALEFGFEFTNGFALDTVNKGPDYFNLKEKTLTKSLITKGRNKSESVNQIRSFTGQAFKIPKDAAPILTLNENFVNKLPREAWEFEHDTQVYNVGGWSQGAYKKYGKGKIVVFGEAAMFTAQLAGPKKIKAGMNSESAPENYQLLLNIIHWLDGRLE